MKAKVAVLIIVLAILLIFYLSTFPFSSVSPKNQIVVLGVDGATWDVINQMIGRGELPNMKKMTEQGSYGNLTSDDLDSNVAWSVILTGVEKEKSGIVNRFSYDLKVDTVFDILDKNNKTVIATHWPIGGDKFYPGTDTIDGLLLLNNPVFEFARKIYYVFVVTIPTSKIDKDLIYDFYLLDYKTREYMFLNNKYSPDVFAIRFEEPDRLQSYFWMYYKDLDKFQYVDQYKLEKYNSVIEKYYENFDKFLGRLIEQNNTIILVSDYGFNALNPPKIVDLILINNILEKTGFLTFDYRGDANMEVSKAYILENGLDDNLVVFINPKLNEGNKVKADVARMLSSVAMQNYSKKIFKVLDGGENRLILQRAVDYKIDQDENIIIQNNTYPAKEFLFRREISGVHDKTGILVLYGADIKEGARIDGATTYDVAPNLLYLNGLQIPKEMKGKVWKDAFAPN